MRIRNEHLPRIIAMCNQKGGVGKTTDTINLAGALASFGRRVLCVDCDPQGNLSSGFKVKKLTHVKGDPTLTTTLIGGGDPHILVAKPFDNIHVIPASMDMVFLSSRLRESNGKELKMKHMLDQFGDEYDHILMDLRPAIDTDTDSETYAADAAILAVDVDEWAMEAVGLQVGQHRKLMQDMGRPKDDLPILGLIINNVTKPMGHFDKAVYTKLQSHPRIPYLGEIPVRSADLKEARHAGQPVQFFRPKSDTAERFRNIAIKAGLVEAA
uniref:ParA family protein n=1 Tax=Streptomyces sp. CA-136453 TaxID=3240050 RepID=UPI003F499A6B